MKNAELAVLFFKLKDMLAKYESFLRVVKDEEGYYRLYTPTRRPFMGICVQRKHVGVYVMPIFENANLNNDLITGFKRAKLAWYTIDPLFFRNTSGRNI